MPHWLRRLLLPLGTVFLLLAADAVFLVHLGRPDALYMNGAALSLPAFRTRDLYGHAVTSDDLQGSPCVICLWSVRNAATSRSLLAKLAAWKEKAPDRLRFIGLIGDLKDMEAADADAARGIAAACPEGFPQLMVNDDFAPLLARIRHAPTTFFADAQGNLVGQPVIGDEIGLIQKEALRLLENETDAPRRRMLTRIQQDIMERP